MDYKSYINKLNKVASNLENFIKISYVPKKYEHIDFKPPKSVAEVAERGLNLRDEYEKGGLTRSEASEKGIGSGIARAVNLKNRDNLSPDTVKRMKAFFDRHSAFKKHHKTTRDKGGPSKSYISWCLTGDTEILLSDGTCKSIKEICENKLPVEVISYNEETGQLEPNPVINWFINPSSIEEFYAVGTNKQHRTSVSSKTYLNITGEHPIYSNGEWVKAENIEGKPIHYIYPWIDNLSDQIIKGSLLGDMHIGKDGRLSESHGLKQASYAKEKFRLLGSLNYTTNNIIQKQGYGKGLKQINNRTKTYEQIKELRKEIYPDGIKKISKSYLDSLEDVAIAFWLMDDWSLHKTNSKKEGFYYRMHVSGFDLPTIENISFWLDSQNLDHKIYKRENCDGSIIYLSPSATEKIALRVAPYIVPSMKYKLPPKLRSISYVLGEKEPQKKFIMKTRPVSKFYRSAEMSDSLKRTKSWGKKYNITVANNNNYIANGILVHNCLWGGDPGYRWAKKVVGQMEKADEKAKKK